MAVADVEPIEVNAGAWYLRALRADDRVDDRPAILSMAQDPAGRRFAGLRHVVDLETARDRVEASNRAWAEDRRCTWAVCEPSTGEMLGEVILGELHRGERWAQLGCVTAPAHRGRGIMTTAVAAVLRLAFAAPSLGGLGLHRVDCQHDAVNTAAAALAARCGFTRQGSAHRAGHDRSDVVVLARLASD